MAGQELRLSFCNRSRRASTFQEKIQQLVLWMGGKVSPVFNAACTHLVTNTQFSEKAKV
jgi:hypothetical protein